MRLYLLPVTLIACGIALAAMAELSVPAARQEIAAPIDFGRLHRQAATALDTLRQSHDRRMAMADAAAF